jgi:tRNA (cmo5U34)-methyltransferase
MLEKARRRLQDQGLSEAVELRCGDLNEDIPLERASLVTMCWTLQFIRPMQRERLIRRLHEALVPGGALIVTEKVLAGSPAMNQLFIERYYEFKKRNGYSNEEIARKREALENVLVPFRLDENIVLFRRSGFEIVETFFQWYNFVGFLCVKTKPSC